MESFSKSLEDELKKMSDEFQKKYADFEKNAAKLPEAIKEVKQKNCKICKVVSKNFNSQLKKMRVKRS